MKNEDQHPSYKVTFQNYKLEWNLITGKPEIIRYKVVIEKVNAPSQAQKAASPSQGPDDGWAY